MPLLSFVCATIAITLPGSDNYLDGKKAERAGNFQDAVELYTRCADADEYLRPYARIRIAASAARAGNPDAAIDGYEEVIKTFPEGPWRRMAQADLALLLTDIGRYDQALPFYVSALDGTPDIWFLYDLRWSYAEASVRTTDAGARAAAFAYARKVAGETVWRSRRHKAAELLEQSDDPLDLLAAGFAWAKSREYPQAERLVPLIQPKVENYIDLRNRLSLLQAKILLGKKKTIEAYQSLLQLAAANPPSPEAFKAYGECVRYLYGASLNEQAERAIDFLKERAPASEGMAEALWWRAEHIARGDGMAATVAAYEAVHEQCPGTDRGAQALYTAANVLREAGQWNNSAEAYLTLAKEYPDHRYYSEAIYWGGSMLERLGENEAATRVYALVNDRRLADYYAHRACERRHELQEAGAPTFADLRAGGATSFVRPLLDPAGYDDLDETFSEQPAIQRLQLFGHHGFDEAEWEALDLVKDIDENPAAANILHTMGEAGVAYTAMQVARAHHWGVNEDGTFTADRLRVNFPRAYWPEVLAISRETGVDPYLILSIAYHESTFRPGLTSHAGARGLMQVMPGTAKYLMRIEPSITETTIANLDSPINSLRLGAHYLMRMIERCDSNYAYALASYNAGPGNLSKWRKARGNIELHDFIEAIPFTETNHYVKKVLGTYAAYRSLYPPAQP